MHGGISSLGLPHWNGELRSQAALVPSWFFQSVSRAKAPPSPRASPPDHAHRHPHPRLPGEHFLPANRAESQVPLARHQEDWTP